MDRHRHRRSFRWSTTRYDYATSATVPTFAAPARQAPVYRSVKLDFWLLSRHAT